MHDLVDFLVEERYCNTESEAIRIIESVSDEFYDYLIETSSDNRLAQLRKELNILMRGKLDPKDTSKIDKIKSLQKEIKELQAQTGISRITGDIQRGGPPKGRAPTPKGPSGGPQKPKDVPSPSGSYSGIPDTRSSRKLDQIASQLTGKSSEPTRSGGRKPLRQLTQRHFTPGVSGGQGTQKGYSGGTAG